MFNAHSSWCYDVGGVRKLKSEGTVFHVYRVHKTIIKTCRDTAKRAETRVGFYPLFSPDSDDRLSLNFHRFVILYISCDTRSVGLGQYFLPKVSNGFKLFVNL